MLTATKNRGERKLRHSGSRAVGRGGRGMASLGVLGEGGTRQTRGQQANLHSLRFLVSCLERDGVNMAEERREVRVEERLKIKIGKLRGFKCFCCKGLQFLWVDFTRPWFVARFL